MILKNQNVRLSNKVLFLYISIAIFLSAAWILYQFGKVANDNVSYQILWDLSVDTSFLDSYSQLRYEIGSYFLFWNLSQITSAAMTFYIFGLISLSSKFYLIKRNYNYPLIAFSLYTVAFSNLLDANQIRAALAMTILIYSLCIRSHNFFSYLILASIAMLFHYSGIVILVLYLTRTPLLGLVGFIVFAFTFEILISDLGFLSILNYYFAAKGQANLTSSVFIMQVIIFILSILFWQKLSYPQQKGAYLNAFGVLVYVLFNDYGLIAHRTRELSQIGILGILFLGDKKLTYIKFFSAICFSYLVMYNLVYVIGKLA